MMQVGWKLIIIAQVRLSLSLSWLAGVHRHQNSLVMTVESPTVIWQGTVKMIHNNTMYGDSVYTHTHTAFLSLLAFAPFSSIYIIYNTL